MKFKIRLVAVVLAAVMAALTPIEVFAGTQAEDHLTNTSAETLEKELKDKTIGNYIGSTTLYVSDLLLANGDTAEAAKKSLHDSGYLVYDCNLNEGTDGNVSSIRVVPKKYTYLGYKITTDRSKAITDLNVMNQEGGYDVYNYLEVAEKNMPGINEMAKGMKSCCYNMRINLASKKPGAAKTAKAYLDLFYVPASVKDTTGPKLGDYLLDEKRTEEDFKELILVLNSLVLNVVNSQLALGTSETSLETTKADGGKDQNGAVVSQYTSYNAVVSYKELKADNDWIINAANKMRDDKNFADVNKEDDSVFFADLFAEYGAQIMAFKRVRNEGSLTETAQNYLKSVMIEKGGGAISAALGLGTSDVSAYDLLTKGSDRVLALFYSNLPDICRGNLFHDVLEVCASDYQHRLPQSFTFDAKYNIPWARTAVNLIEGEKKSPTSKSTMAPYNSDIDSFIALMKTYATQYKEGMEEYKNHGYKIVLDGFEMTEDEAHDLITDSVNNQSEVSNIPYIFHVGIKNAFEQYKLSDDRTLLDYLINAVDEGMNEEDQRRAIYPVVRALDKSRLYSIKSCNMLGFLINSIMTENEYEGTFMSLDKYRLELEEEQGSKTVNVWWGTQRDLIEEGEYVAITNESVAANIEESRFKKLNTNTISKAENLKSTLVKLGIAGGSLLAGAIILFGTSTLLVTLASAAMDGLSALTCMGICAATVCATVMTITGYLALVVVAIIAIAIIAVLIAYIIELYKPEPDPVYTKIPTIMIDSTKDKNGDLTDIAKYFVVRDPDGKAADIKAFQSRGWIALYYTYDESAGSPIVLGPGNSFFASSKGESVRPDDKCVCLSKFLRSDAYNLNSNCYYDTVSGIYFFFYTEKSLAGEDTGVLKGKYIESIVIAHSKTDLITTSYLNGLKDYSLFAETNLSPNCAYNTYIAYTTTNTASKALTDIRAATGTDAEKIGYGSVIYTSVLEGFKDMRKCPAITCEKDTNNREETEFYYGLYTSKDPSVGDPILTSSLSILTDISKLKDDYTAVSYFAGVPLDFNSYEHEGYTTFDKHYYICYSSENAKISDTDYLAGFGFFSGSEDWLSSSDSKEYTLEKYAELSYGAKLIPTNLTPSLLNNPADRTYLGYVTTKNPKKALTEISVFTGEPKSCIFPQNLTVGSNYYCACDVFTQGDWNYYGTGGSGRQRWIRPSHTYFTAAINEFNAAESFDGFHWPEYTAVMPRALYCCGPHAGVEAIKISEVFYSTSSKDAPVHQSNNKQANSHLYRLSADNDPQKLENVQDIGLCWKSVHSIDRYYYDEYNASGNLLSSFDMGLGVDNPTGDTTGSGHLYMYYRNGSNTRRRGNYISYIKLSGGIMKDNSYNSAVFNALAITEDIVNIDNPITLTDKAFDGFSNGIGAYYKTTISDMKEYDDGCYFVSVTYSDSMTNAVGSARVVQQGWGDHIIEKSLSLPLYNSTSKVSYDQTSLAVFNGEEGEKSKEGLALYKGYALYSTTSGYTANRADVRFINIEPRTTRSDTLSNAGSGVAEYYVGYGDTTDPFLFQNYATGEAACICLQSYSLDASGQNKDKYIEDIAIVEATSLDGNMDMAAAKLGAMGYPYLVDFDISENAAANGSNTVTALGVRRTDNPKSAIKDIRISSDNLGLSFDASGIRYQRVNDKPAKLSGADKDGVYLYVTYGSSSDTMLWSEITENNIPLEKVDWFSLDYEEAQKDPNFEDQKVDYFATHPGLSTSVNTYLAGIDAKKLVDYGLPGDWQERYALTNIGFVPHNNSPEQTVRQMRNEKVKDTYWAGCSAFKEDKLIVPVTDNTAKQRIFTFDATETSIGLRYTNSGNERFAPFGTDADKEAEVSASVISGRNILIIIILSASFLLALAVAYIVYRKKRTVDKH